MPPAAHVGGAGGGTSGELAERGTRLAAATIDDLIMLIISLPALYSFMPLILGAVMNYSGGDLLSSGDLFSLGELSAVLRSTGGIITILAFIAWCATTARLVWANGQTIGKRMVGIKVVRKDGSRASFGRIFWLRNALNSILGWLPLIGYLYQLVDALLIFQDSRQCLHDRIADTIVVRA